MQNGKENGLDVTGWILSEEIRDYLRKTGYAFSIEEKTRIIHSGYRPLEEKYAALQELRKEAETEEDRQLVTETIRLYDWAFSKIEKETAGQIFAFRECNGFEIGETYAMAEDEGLFHTYEECWKFVQEYLKGYLPDARKYDKGTAPKEVERWGEIVKWEQVDGKMEETIYFNVYIIRGKICLQRFESYFLEHNDKLCSEIGVTGNTLFELEDMQRNWLPLPFQNGDLVCLNPPDWSEPLYGILYVYEAGGRYIHMLYIRDFRMKHIDLGYWGIGISSDMPVIDWLHPVEAADLPEGTELLAEMSEYVLKLARKDPEAADEFMLDNIWGNEKTYEQLTAHVIPLSLEEWLEATGRRFNR